MKRFRELLRRTLVPALALITAFVLGAILIVLTDIEHLQQLGSDPGGALAGALAGVFEGYGAMFSGAIGDPGRIVAAIQSGSSPDIARAIRPITETLLNATPFIFVGLGLVVSFRAGLFNLGADGQYVMGGLGATITAILLQGTLPPFVIIIVALAGGALFGAMYAFVPGLLKVRTGAHEVITTLMLNAIAPNLAALISGSGAFGSAGGPIPRVPLIFDMATIRLDYGFVAALLVAAAVSMVLFRTTLGFELRATGFNRSAARGAGIRTGRSTMLAMSLSGGLVGLGSAFYLLGPANGLPGPPTPDMGFVAIALALIAGLRPSGVVLVALLYGALNNGASHMVVVTGIPLALLVAIIGFALMFVAAPGLVRTIWRLRPAERDTELVPVESVGRTQGI
jgi:general nucleoside transport system permease protein